MTSALDLETLTLAKGSHYTRDDGLCIMEAVAFFAGEPHSDRPECVSSVLRNFGMSLNDNFEAATRQKLIPIIPLTIGTAHDGYDEARRFMVLDWLVRTFTPAWLDLVGLTAEAQALRDLRRIVDLTAAQAAGPVVKDARAKADAAWAAAWAAAGAAAGDAAGDAAWAAVGAAAGAAAGDAAWVAAGDAIWAAAGAAAGDAAWVAAGAAVGGAAGAAARDAVGAAVGAAARAAARDAVGGAAGDKMRPTVEALQASALDLFRAMCLIGHEEVFTA